jgi:NitT/TauT family transport system substrate-binding protein
MKKTSLAAIVASTALLLTACGGMSGESSEESVAPASSPDAAAASADGSAAASGAAAAEQCTEKTPVTVVLQWVTQAQFAGYFAAKDLGYYEDECLDVTIQEGGVNVVPQQVLASGNADFAVSLATKSMVSREEGSDIVNIGQVFQRGSYLQIGWADSGIKTLADLEGTKVGSWGYGNELILFAAMRANGVEPDQDAEIVQQPFDMSLLLNREVDTAQALTYNEYAQLLETVNPDTGELYTPEDFTILNLEELGFPSVDDGVYATAEWLADPANEDIAVRFLKASYRGWIQCRDDVASCVDIVLNNGSALGAGHQTWMMNEVNKLIWPSPEGIGTMPVDKFNQVMQIAVDAGVLKALPAEGAYRTDLSQKADDELAAEGFDVTGEAYEPITVTLTEGGQ